MLTLETCNPHGIIGITPDKSRLSQQGTGTRRAMSCYDALAMPSGSVSGTRTDVEAIGDAARRIIDGTRHCREAGRRPAAQALLQVLSRLGLQGPRLELPGGRDSVLQRLREAGGGVQYCDDRAGTGVGERANLWARRQGWTHSSRPSAGHMPDSRCCQLPHEQRGTARWVWRVL